MQEEVDSKTLYPPLEPYAFGWLKVDNLHEIYFEESGNPQGVPILFVHGGPGGGTVPKHRQFFDPEYYRIILVDQRGCGKSQPLGELRNNTTQYLIEDFEKLRNHLKIKKWHLFGGSWGSTLSIAYAAAYPEVVLGLILRGIFLGRSFEYDWLYRQVRFVLPQYYEPFIAYLPEEERADPLKAYAKRILGEDPRIAEEASRRWTFYEMQCCAFIANPEKQLTWESSEVNPIMGRIAAHYCINHCFLPEEGVLPLADKIRHLPIHIVQGKYDMVCPSISAYDLLKRLPDAKFTLIEEGGHLALDSEAMTQALIRATNQMRTIR